MVAHVDEGVDRAGQAVLQKVAPGEESSKPKQNVQQQNEIEKNVTSSFSHPHPGDTGLYNGGRASPSWVTMVSTCLGMNEVVTHTHTQHAHTHTAHTHSHTHAHSTNTHPVNPTTTLLERVRDERRKAKDGRRKYSL